LYGISYARDPEKPFPEKILSVVNQLDILLMISAIVSDEKSLMKRLQ